MALLRELSRCGATTARIATNICSSACAPAVSGSVALIDVLGLDSRTAETKCNPECNPSAKDAYAMAAIQGLLPLLSKRCLKCTVIRLQLDAHCITGSAFPDHSTRHHGLQTLCTGCVFC